MLHIQIDVNPVDLNSMLASLLQVGGPDQHYTFVATEDLRPYNISANFILQVLFIVQYIVKFYNKALNTHREYTRHLSKSTTTR